MERRENQFFCLSGKKVKMLDTGVLHRDKEMKACVKTKKIPILLKLAYKNVPHRNQRVIPAKCGFL